MGHTIYTNYTNAELLTAFSNLRHRSQVIDELCGRLEGNRADDANELPYKCTVECPVCMADMRLDVDRLDDSLYVSVL